MSTTGFGDLAPKTNVGYLVSTITMYSGVMMISIIVLLLRDAFDLNSSNFLLYSRIKKNFKNSKNSLVKKLD